LSKLNEATTLVDELKHKAAEQSALLAQKQTEADEALKEITVSMQVLMIGHQCMSLCSVLLTEDAGCNENTVVHIYMCVYNLHALELQNLQY